MVGTARQSLQAFVGEAKWACLILTVLTVSCWPILVVSAVSNRRLVVGLGASESEGLATAADALMSIEKVVAPRSDASPALPTCE